MTGRAFPALGFDPAPGDLAAVAAILVALASAVETAAATLPRLEEACAITDDADWGGSAAEEFSDHGDDLPMALGTGVESMGAVATALGTWAGQLRANQDRADELEHRASRLRRQLTAAEDALTTAAAALPHDIGHPDYPARYETYLTSVRQVGQLDDALQAVLADARRLAARHLREADTAAAGVRSGPDDAFRPENDAWYVQTLDGVSTVSGVVSAATAAAAAGLALTGVGAPAAAVLGTVSAGTAGVGTLAGIGQRIAGSRNAPSNVQLALTLVPGRTYTSAAVGAGRGLLRAPAGTSRLRAGAREAAAGAATGFATGGLPRVLTDLRDLHRHTRQHGSLTDGLRTTAATTGLNLVGKGDGRLASEAFVNTVDATARGVSAVDGPLSPADQRGLELVKLLANPRLDAAETAVVNLTRDELHRRETGR